MIEYCAFYDENGERHVVRAKDRGKFYKALPPGREWDFPDEVQLIGVPLIKRTKTIQELKDGGFTGVYEGYTPFAAKDIPLSWAVPKESN